MNNTLIIPFCIWLYSRLPFSIAIMSIIWCSTSTRVVLLCSSEFSHPVSHCRVARSFINKLCYFWNLVYLTGFDILLFIIQLIKARVHRISLVTQRPIVSTPTHTIIPTRRPTSISIRNIIIHSAML